MSLRQHHSNNHHGYHNHNSYKRNNNHDDQELVRSKTLEVPVVAAAAQESEMNKAIVGDDDVKAFNYFLTGKASGLFTTANTAGGGIAVQDGRNDQRIGALDQQKSSIGNEQ